MTAKPYTYTLTAHTVKPLPEEGVGSFQWDVFMAPKTARQIVTNDFPRGVREVAEDMADKLGYACTVSVHVHGRKPPGFDKEFGQAMQFFDRPVHPHYEEG